MKISLGYPHVYPCSFTPRLFCKNLKTNSLMGIAFLYLSFKFIVINPVALSTFPHQYEN